MAPVVWNQIGDLAGPAGEQGETGETGSAGADGAAGSAGAAGPRGSKWYAGSGAPDVVALSAWTPNAVTEPPAIGDFYINLLTSEYGPLTSV